MIVASHQCDLLPYSGFWHKMARADLFGVMIDAQFQSAGFQRRVPMRGSWVSLPVVGNPRRRPIRDVRILPRTARESLVNSIVGRYRGARHWDEHGPWLVRLIEETCTEHLWQFNLALILGIRDRLGIETPVALGRAPHGRGSEALVDLLHTFGADTYLSGPGGRNYMGDCHEFTEAGIEVEWSQHRPSTSDSVVSLLMDHDDPMAHVLAVHGSPRVPRQRASSGAGAAS